MEQVILAGEAGCISVSPFVHELRAHLDMESVISVPIRLSEASANDHSYHDPDPILDLVPRAQRYYEQHGIETKVKACAFMTIDEIISLAGVDAMTIPAETLEELSSMTESQEKLEAKSSFYNADRHALMTNPQRLSYIDDKVKFDRSFTTNGRGKAKTEDVSDRGVLRVSDSG
ncbi:hypothetical protein CP533_2447 [Ophiocordyceps camponoti-saundersi (nom. inval.)]|nr:hypothetical protein CP533_2447 [Ophiocordyceps camponoti-saundersi (nom. inval.)]